MDKNVRTAAIVEVVFLDGEIKEYTISASPSIGGYLAREAGETGVLSMFNLDESYAVPMGNIREWRVKAAEQPK